MEIKAHGSIAEVLSDTVVIATAGDGLDLMGNLYYQGYEGIVLYEKNITASFFDLKTGIAGEILQKFSNYRMRLALVGDFSKYESKALKDFIFESNKSGRVNFVDSLEDALKKLSHL